MHLLVLIGVSFPNGQHGINKGIRKEKAEYGHQIHDDEIQAQALVYFGNLIFRHEL